MKSQKNIIIHAQALELSHLRPDDSLSLCAGENTLVVVPERMTALQAAHTIAVLTEFTSELLDAVKDACGTCGEQREAEGECPYTDFCEADKCPYEGATGPEVELSDAARKQMGIPLGAKLQLLPDEGKGLVVPADYKHDLTDVPEEVRALLDLLGVCPGELDDLIRNEEEIWHG